MFILRFIRSFYLTGRFFLLCFALSLLALLGFFFPVLLPIAKIVLFAIPAVLVFDCILAWSLPKGIMARRIMMDKLSNGDYNEVKIVIESRYPMPMHCKVVDELPVQFQARDLAFNFMIMPRAARELTYKVRPVKRGEYRFGAVNVYISTVLRLVERRFRFAQEQNVPVYPSFIQMRRFELLAISNRLTEAGIKKIRRRGQNNEFDQIKDYVPGDDPRTVNWKASARRSRLMVNTYQDEKSQQVVSLIDMGRVMKMPFEEMTLLDYSINASLVISNIAMQKYDKAGVVTFSHKIHQMLAPERRGLQLYKIMELLYGAKTGFLESDYERLYMSVKQRLTQRSLLLLFTNFESLSSMQRQLKYLRRLAKDHLLVVIFFENTELRAFLDERPVSVQEIYYKTVAEKFTWEKKLIVKELEQYGIHAVYTAPQNLTVNTINKYLELKARGLI